MSQATMLLNNLSNTPAPASASPVHDPFIIDAETRTISVPKSEVLFGVEGDKDVERKYFQCPKIVGDNIDLSTLNLQIHYKNSLGEMNKCDVSDLEEIDGVLAFTWLLSSDLLKSKGSVQFSIRAMSEDEEGNEICVWNTTYASGTVLEGLNANEEELGENDVIINSSTEGSNKQFKINIYDDGTLVVKPL